MSETRQVAHTYTPRPLIMWKLSKVAASQIECGKGCKRHARYGYSADGGAPYFYVCSKHVPVGVPVRLCANSAANLRAKERFLTDSGQAAAYVFLRYGRRKRS